MCPYLLSVDVGSSICKTVLFDEKFRIKAKTSEEITSYHPKPHWGQQEPDEWFTASVTTIQRLISESRVDPSEIKGIGVSGQSHGPVLLDESNKPLYPCIVWADLRCVEEAKQLSIQVGREESPYYTPSKLFWLKRNEPEIWSRVAKIVLPKDYVRGQFIGKMVTDETDARFTMMYNVKTRKWSSKHLKALEIEDNIFPEVYPSDKIVGTISQRAAEQTGLKEGTPVVAGAGDSTCVILGLRPMMKPRRALIYLGTAPAFLAVFNDPLPGQPQRSWVNLKEGHLYGQFMSVGGASLRWLKDTFKMGDLDTVNPYKILDEEAEAMPVGSDGLTFLPHIMGERSPALKPEARGVLYGLSVGHTRGHVVRAVLEGIAFNLRWMYESMGAEGLIDELIVSGGGANSRIWRSIISNVFRMPVYRPSCTETTALGLAFLTSVGTGTYRRLKEASDMAELHILDCQEPQTEVSSLYKISYKRYMKLEKTVAPLYNYMEE